MYIVFDIGGTNTRVGFSESGTTDSVRIESFKTPKKPKEAMHLIAQTAKKLAGDSPFSAAAGGVAAILNKERTGIVSAPNLPQWNDVPITKLLQQELNVPVYIENDTAMWALAEALEGAGSGKNIVVYVTVSTGVGGCRIVDGAIDKAVYSFEPGHQMITHEHARTCTCGKKDHLEGLIGGAAMEKLYRKHPKDITDKNVWRKAEEHLAIGLNNLIVFWSPDIIVLGGSMLKDFDLSRVTSLTKDHVAVFPEIPTIVHSTFGDEGGIKGSILYLAQKHSTVRNT